ncbi:MAG: c-type cytochrome [Proteobacteria bacterium]|nr:c-type cytochrome [Pseudomonadota bacterium]MBS0494105.1 c-type cytochrome [Pseudomonadota bacterium]
MRSALVLAAALAAASAWADGDAQRGRLAYEARCGGCHSVDADRIGPRHAGIVGRRAGSVPGFAYSDALRSSGLVWDAALLDRWLANPEALVPGQRMGYRLADAQERADIIAYLATLGSGRH